MSTPRKTIWFKDSFHQVHRNKLSLHSRSLQDILEDEIWEKLFGTFNSQQRAWVECEQKCSKNLVDKNYAVGWLTN
jgi:hypothetical protein